MDRPLSSPAEEAALLGGRLRFRQPATGYRAGTDAALLAAACDAKPAQRVLDLGCGAGAAMLAAAARRPGARFVGVERDPSIVSLAVDNVRLNGMESMVRAMIGDVSEPWTRLGEPAFDAAICNPPFFDDPSSLRAPAREKLGAWFADEGLDGWLAFMTRALRSGGTITVIHRADRLGDLLGGLSPKAGSIQIRPVHPHADDPAKRVIVRAVNGGRAPLRLLPPLVLHERESGAKYTPEAEAILRGAADLPWL